MWRRACGEVCGALSLDTGSAFDGARGLRLCVSTRPLKASSSATLRKTKDVWKWSCAASASSEHEAFNIATSAEHASADDASLHAAESLRDRSVQRQ